MTVGGVGVGGRGRGEGEGGGGWQAELDGTLATKVLHDLSAMGILAGQYLEMHVHLTQIVNYTVDMLEKYTEWGVKVR